MSRNILLSELTLNGILTLCQCESSLLKKKDLCLVMYEEEDTQLIQRVLNLITCQICEQICFLYSLKLHLEKFPPPTHGIAPMFICSRYFCRSSFNHLHAQWSLPTSGTDSTPLPRLAEPPTKMPVLSIYGVTKQTRRCTFYRSVMLGCHIWNHSLFGGTGSGIAYLSSPESRCSPLCCDEG